VRSGCAAIDTGQQGALACGRMRATADHCIGSGLAWYERLPVRPLGFLLGRAGQHWPSGRCLPGCARRTAPPCADIQYPLPMEAPSPRRAAPVTVPHAWPLRASCAVAAPGMLRSLCDLWQGIERHSRCRTSLKVIMAALVLRRCSVLSSSSGSKQEVRMHADSYISACQLPQCGARHPWRGS
jgi:hypothetical protein